jgi:anti-anti-sigma factor
MNVKIDTKEKFQAIRVLEPILSVNMTDSFEKLLLNCLEENVKNVVLNMEEVQEMDSGSADLLVKTQQVFYDHNFSFVLCCIRPELEAKLDEWGSLEMLNTTPTESEAWDIVQMEEIEREFLREDEESV